MNRFMADVRSSEQAMLLRHFDYEISRTRDRELRGILIARRDQSRLAWTAAEAYRA